MLANFPVDEISRIIECRADELIVPRFRNLTASQINTKSHANDFVTIADIETEHALRADLTAKFPGCIVIGEEAVSSGAMNTDALKDRLVMTWVADPVDGTTNFKNGDETFGVILALVMNGEVVGAWLYDVMGGMHHIAIKGQGAYKVPKGYTGSYKDGEKLQVSKQQDLDASKGFIAPYYFPPAARPFLKSALNGRFPSLHCSAHEYMRVASGQAEHVVVNHMKPWDHLAGALLVQEAGGVVKKFDGSKYQPWDESGGVIVANNMVIMDQLRKSYVNPVLHILKTPAP